MESIGGYRLKRRLGKGGMAEVWVAQREGVTSTKYVAIKFIISHHADDERYLKMFESEAKLSGLLTHSNIVQVFDAGQDNGRAYLVMEWVDGPSLSSLMPTLWAVPDIEERQRLAAFVIGQLLYGLAYAHKVTTGSGDSLGIVHRDVSPHNVLVSVSGDVKLTDFGIAHRASEETSGLHVKGKLRYMPREQLSGESRAATVDLYAVGAILHEMLDGRKFRHDAETEVQMYGAALGGQIPSVQFPVPPELEALRVGLLQPEPKDRIQTAEDALRMLKKWRGNQDMRLELGELCAQATGITGPRTGIAGTVAPGAVHAPFMAQSPEPPGTMILPEPEGATGSTGGSAAGAPRVDPTMALDGPLPVADRMTRSPEESTATAPHAAAVHGGPPETSPNLADPSLMYARPPGNPWPRRIALGFGAFVAIGLLAVGSGWALIKLTEPQREAAASAEPIPAPAPAAAAPAAAEVAESPAENPAGPVIPGPSAGGDGAGAVAAGDEARSAQAGNEAEQVEAEAEAAPEPAPEPEPEPEPPAPEPAPKPKASPSKSPPSASTPTKREEPSGPPVTVHFRLQDIDAAYVRLNGKQFSVTPRHTTRLPSGTYTVRWRRSPNESWKRAKSMNIGPDVEWVIRVGESGPVLLDLRRAFQ
jgi:predicted Ser/Thr protein kinase